MVADCVVHNNLRGACTGHSCVNLADSVLAVFEANKVQAGSWAKR